MTTSLKCENIEAAFAKIPACEPTNEGLRFTTHCLYPSFEPVDVYVVRVGDGLIVHDGGGAARVAWLHGREQNAIGRALAQEAALHDLELDHDRLSLEIDSEEWLPQAILAVANASGAAARAVVDAMTQASENALHDAIVRALREVVRSELIATDGVNLRGKSGKTHHFDLAVQQPKGIALIDYVSPHHVSIAAKYVAFSDTSGIDADVAGRFIIHDKPLNTDDVALLTQCADVVPVAAMKPTFANYFRR
jgi:hypothetical protein